MPSLSPAGEASAPASGEQAWAGLVGYKDARFGDGSGQEIVLRVLRAQWRAAVVAADGSVHRDVLAVALRVTCTKGAEGPLRLGQSAELRLSNGRARRSGRFPVAGQLRAVRPGETGQGWLVFENVDWDALRGNMQPPASRFSVNVPVGGAAVGTGLWMVDAWGTQHGAVRRVGLRVLEASVGYMTL